VTPRRERVLGVGAEEARVEYIVIASGVALAIGVRVVSLIWEFRDTFPQPQHAEPNPIPSGCTSHVPVVVRAATRGLLASELGHAWSNSVKVTPRHQKTSSPSNSASDGLDG
jgi:hypothetical protein